MARDKSITGSGSTSLAKAGAQAFTLVELVALCLVFILAALLVLPTLVRAQQRAVQVSCRANLRRLGMALQNYASANDGSLPGPLFALSFPRYDPASTNQLAWFIAKGTASTPAAVVPLLLCPAHQATTDTLPSAASYVLDDGRGDPKGLAQPPFGRPKAPVSLPLKLSQLSTLTSPATCWAIADADKGNVNPTLPGWNALPYKPVHGQVRNQLYFDWHVGAKRW